MDLFDYINQDRVWIPKAGEPMKISDMDVVWRKNAARWMIRHAGSLRTEYRIVESMKAIELFVDQEELDIWKSFLPLHELLEQISKPDQWVMQTTLYQALTKDIPHDPRDEFSWRRWDNEKAA